MEHHKTFLTAKLAESFRSEIIVAARQGASFDARTGMPPAVASRRESVWWYDHAAAFIDMKWPHASPRHRKSIAEGLVTVTCALTSRRDAGPPLTEQRIVLTSWSFNTTARGGVPVSEAVPRTTSLKSPIGLRATPSRSRTSRKRPPYVPCLTPDLESRLVSGICVNSRP